jgi:hypothetical protein
MRIPIGQRRLRQAASTNSSSEPKAQRWGVLLLGLVAVACVTALVFVVLHHATDSSTPAITALSTLGSAAVGGIAGMLTSSSAGGGLRASRQQATITLSVTSGAAGDPFTVSGSGFGPGEPVAITFGASSLASATADTYGNFTQAQSVPPVSAGPWVVSATGNITSATATTAFNVT